MQLSSDPFMKQVNYASQIVPLLEKDDNDTYDCLIAQLSHSDGIRGFFVSYLTSDNDTDKEVPKLLIDAMKSIKDQKDLVKLAIMNVIMPTAMSTMHTDLELQTNSSNTAKKGLQVLKELTDHPDVSKHCNAIHHVATSRWDVDGEFNDDLHKYWFEFMKNYGYEEKQRDDIASVVKQFL